MDDVWHSDVGYVSRRCKICWSIFGTIINFFSIKLCLSENPCRHSLIYYSFTYTHTHTHQKSFTHQKYSLCTQISVAAIFQRFRHSYIFLHLLFTVSKIHFYVSYSFFIRLNQLSLLKKSRKERTKLEFY